MVITLPNARTLSDDILEVFRLRALHGLERGYTETALAERLGVSRETICRGGSAFPFAGLLRGDIRPILPMPT